MRRCWRIDAALPKRERRSTQRLFEELRGRGYDGARDSVQRFVRAWRQGRAPLSAPTFIPLRFERYVFCRSRRDASQSGRTGIGWPIPIFLSLEGPRTVGVSGRATITSQAETIFEV